MYKMEILLALWRRYLATRELDGVKLAADIDVQELFFDNLGRVWKYKLY